MNKENEVCLTSQVKRHRSTSKYLLREIGNNCQTIYGRHSENFPRKRNEGISRSGIHVNRLPIEILCMVFSYLTPSELAKSVLPVCKHWNEIGNGPLFWRTLKFGTRGSTEDLRKVVEKSTLLKSVEIENRNDFGAILQSIYSNCKHSDTKVEEITLKMCVFHSLSKHTESYQGCAQLRTCCVTSTSSHRVGRGGTLNVPFSTNMMVFCPSLKKLNLINMVIRSKKFFSQIGATLTSLTTLTIVRCHYFSPANLRLIAANCTQLSHVTLLYNVTNTAFVDLETRNSWDQAYRDILLKRGELLRVFEIDAEFIRDSTLMALSASSRLHTLALENAYNLSEEGIRAIGRLRYLDNLYIHNCPGLTKETVVQLFGAGNLGLLETLSLTRCRRITDSCLEVVASSCHRINKINLSFCQLITDGGVEILFQKCINLRYLNLFSTTGILGSSFKLIPQRTPNLRLLVIEEYCNKIKEKCMKDLIARFPGLLIRRCKQIQ